MNSEIKYIEYYLPEQVLTNDELALLFPDWAANKIESKIGIRQRHVVRENETALDLAFQACNKLLSHIDKSEVDFLILCTQSPDYYLPTSACILQDRLGLKTSVGAFDFNLGCSGFVYGLAIAKGLISAGIATNVILVTSETYSKHIHPMDKSNRSIFGDGAAACLIAASEHDKINQFSLGTDGAGYENLIIRYGGLRQPTNPKAEDRIDDNGNIRNDNNLFMDGPEIFNFTIEAVPILVENTLKLNNMTINEIDYFIFHQANQYMLNYLRDIIEIPEEKFYLNMLNTGNTVSATIPIAIKDALDNGLIKSGDKVLIAGFGVGYSYGAAVITI